MAAASITDYVLAGSGFKIITGYEDHKNRSKTSKQNIVYIYTTTKYKWYFMLDASTNSTCTTTKWKWYFMLDASTNSTYTLQNTNKL